MLHIREATLADIESILHLTNYEIVNGTVFWATTPRTYQEQMTWFTSKRNANLPILVAIDQNEKLLGFTSYGSFKAYEGYHHTVEHSVYVDTHYQGQGIGTPCLKN